MSRNEKVSRPTRKNEYEIIFASNGASKGWAKLIATKPNQLAEAWDFLTATPLQRSVLSYPLKGPAGLISKDGHEHELWQLKLNLRDGARIWYFVVDNRVYLQQVHTSHPNQTK